jgi:hypothetical protein
VTTKKEVNTQQSQSDKDISMYSESASNECLTDSECLVMKIDTPAEYDAIINNNSDQSDDEKLDNNCACVENLETQSLSEDMIAFADGNNISFCCEDEKPTWASCAAKVSILGDLAITMQTLASTTIQNEDFNPGEFLVQVVELSNRTNNLASDLYMEAQKLLREHQEVTHFECVSKEDNDLVDHDPGKRPLKLSDNQKKHLIMLGPCQPKLSVFPKTKELELNSKQSKFSSSWYREFPHLEYSVSRDAAFCFVCSLFPHGPGRSKADQSWIKGISWFKMKGSLGRKKEGKLLSHFTSESHKAALMDFLSFTKYNSHVDVQLSKEMRACLLAEEKLRLQNTEVVTILLDVARTLARQGLAFRGDGNDTEGNFNQITRLLSRHNPSLNHWLESKDMKQFQTTYMSGKSQNEFIHLLADAVRENIVNEVSVAGMFGVMADTTPDVSNKDQLAVAVRYLDTDDHPVERLVQVKEATDKTGEEWQTKFCHLYRSVRSTIQCCVFKRMTALPICRVHTMEPKRSFPKRLKER